MESQVKTVHILEQLWVAPSKDMLENIHMRWFIYVH